MITNSYPEHDRLNERAELRVALNEFAAWLSDQGVHLVRYDAANQAWPITMEHRNAGRDAASVVDGLIAKFLGVDETKLKAERQAMMADLHELARSA